MIEIIIIQEKDYMNVPSDNRKTININRCNDGK